MMIGKFDKEGDGYRGRIFSRERCGRVITFRPMPIKQSDGPDFVVASETQDGDRLDEIGVAWERTTSTGKPYLLVKLDRPTFWNGAHCVLIEQQGGSFALVWKRTRQKAEEAAEAVRVTGPKPVAGPTLSPRALPGRCQVESPRHRPA